MATTRIGGRTKLLRKYDLSGELPLLEIMHPAHLSYVREMRLNSLNYFFEVLDKLDPPTRDKALDWALYFVIQPRYRKSVSGKEKLRELMIDEISYEAFKRKCFELSTHLPEFLLVSAIVSLSLQAWLGLGDATIANEKINKLKSDLEWSEALRKTYKGESDEHVDSLNFVIDSMKKEKADFHEDDLEDYFTRMASFLQETIDSFPARTKEHYDVYLYFCENIVKPLLIEDALR